VSKKLVTLADFQGLKMRSVQSPLLAAGLQALGANPTTLPAQDIFQAMQSHTVDGMEANLGLIQTYKLYEVAKYVTANVNLWPFPTVLIMNKDKFGSLSADQQKAITDAAALVPDFSIKIFTDPTTNLVQTLCDEGLKFAVAKPEDVAAMAAATKPVIASSRTRAPTPSASWVRSRRSRRARRRRRRRRRCRPAVPPSGARSPLPAGPGRPGRAPTRVG